VITLAVVMILTFLICAGGCAGLYFWLKRTVANMATRDPVRIRKLTSDIVDITLPREFIPEVGGSMLGTTYVKYRWCPTGTCTTGDTSELSIIELATDDPSTIAGEDMNEVLESELRDSDHKYIRKDHEIEIRGQKVKFVFLLEDDDGEAGAERQPSASNDQATENSESANSSGNQDGAKETSSATSNSTDAEDEAASAINPANSGTKGKPSWLIQGLFRSKHGGCTLTLSLKQDEYDEEKILNMLKSIR
jgi:hypothetical protein